MLLGLSTFAFAWTLDAAARGESDLDEVRLVQFVAEQGLACLQLGDNLPVHEFSPERLARFCEASQVAGLRIELGARGLRADKISQYLDLCRRCKSPLLRFVMDEGDYRPSIPYVVGLLKAFVPELEQSGITLGIENHDRFKAVELANLIEAVGSEKVGICLDTVNSLGANEGGEWVTQALAPYTVNLHIKDFMVKRIAGNMGFVVEGRPAGKGMLDLEYTLDALRPFQRCQSAVLELWPPAQALSADTLRQEYFWVLESLGFLKPLFRSRFPT